MTSPEMDVSDWIKTLGFGANCPFGKRPALCNKLRTFQPDGIDLHLRIEGLASPCSELRISGGSTQEAA
jgi:hypothetical protein